MTIESHHYYLIHKGIIKERAKDYYEENKLKVLEKARLKYEETQNLHVKQRTKYMCKDCGKVLLYASEKLHNWRFHDGEKPKTTRKKYRKLAVRNNHEDKLRREIEEIRLPNSLMQRLFPSSRLITVSGQQYKGSS